MENIILIFHSDKRQIEAMKVRKRPWQDKEPMALLDWRCMNTKFIGFGFMWLMSSVLMLFMGMGIIAITAIIGSIIIIVCGLLGVE